ncbi:MAG TPA: 2-amino-4-hydroxy-6-hydroxymethyldihydropteridine diphosphokinase [Burkholderiales bacterium]|nr:2-amino-4-hydroxy-6-hydroxymethyldihydropteridine diphosphokinase [Burkholderiales bacterium]
MAEKAFIGLGANIGDPGRQLRNALAALDGIPGTRLMRASSLWRTAPVGYAAQPDFVNAVAEVETAQAPRALLEALLAIEKRFGRERSFANAPRTLDLDLLLYGDRVLSEQGLELPHPRMHERAFVLAPLVEIAPEVEIPGKGRAHALLARCRDQRIEKAG